MDDDLERAARIAADPDAPIALRVDALARVVDETSLRGAAIPDVIADAIDDLALVDGAIGSARAGAVIAAVVLLGPRPELASSRRRVVRRLVAAGATGIALAGLAIAIGDIDTGVRLTTRDYHASILSRIHGGADPVVAAWLGIVADWPDDAAVAVFRALAPVTRLFAHATPEQLPRLRQLAKRLAAS